MNLKLQYTTLLLSLCAIFPACNDQDDVLIDPSTGPDNGKTPIELSVGGVDSQEPTTRAVVTDNPYNPHNFTMNTKIFMVMKSEYGTTDYQGSHTTKYTVARGDVAANSNKVTFDSYNQRYWDDAHARSSELSIWAYAQQDIPSGDGWLSATFQIPNSTWSPQTPETPEHLLQEYESHQYFTNNVTNPWVDEVAGHDKGAIYPCIMTWKASHNSSKIQDANSLKYQDLLFSNNLVNYDTDKTDASKNKSLKFDFVNRKFPQEGEAQMNFYHAMSKITIKIVEGEGFNTSSEADFQFTPSTSNVKLSGFNTEGTFNIKNGYFEKVDQHYDIPSIAKTTNKGVNPNPYYTLEALAIPNIDGINSYTDGFSRFVSGKKDYATDVMMEFTIDNNKYQVTSGQLYDALHVDGNPANALVTNATEKTNNGNYIPLEAGKNYVFTFIVGKQKIEHLTAQVADWENVDAEPFNPTNARIKLQLEERGAALTSDVAFWKANDNNSGSIDDNYATYNWKTGYTNLNATYSSTHWTTNYFWESNKDFYHFRALMPATTGVTTATDDYATLTSGASYTDVRWGAPMKDDGDNETAGTFKWTYDPSTNGFDNAGHTQIYKAIGPTEDPVKLILFHMMSDLTINVKTTTGADAVNLGDGSSNKTKVELVEYKTGGQLLLGNGLVKPTGDPTTADIAQNTFTAAVVSPATSAIAKYVYGAVPQDLTAVKLRITTPDHNQYIVDLWDSEHPIAATVTNNNIANPYTETSSGSGKYKIDRWYPGFKYTYTFTLAKTGITNLEATIVDWENVTADNEIVKIQ